MLQGKVTVPPSKSIAQRAIIMALLSNGKSEIRNIGKSDDVMAAISLLRDLGGKAEYEDNIVRIKGGLRPDVHFLNVKESGLSLRIATVLSAVTGKNFVITGEGTLMRRPVSMLEQALYQGGVICQTNGGFLPISFHGKLRSGNYLIDASVTSQIVTGLLIALPYLKGDSVLFVRNLSSKPYVDVTLNMLRKFGVKIKHYEYERFIILGNQKYKSVKYTVEGDWSSAAFWFVAGAIAGDLTISGLDAQSLQGDRVIVDALKAAGVETTFDGTDFRVRKSKIAPFTFDAADCPDLIPVLTLLAACAEGTSTIFGAERLRFKESNRGVVLKEEFGKLNIAIDIQDNKLTVEGGRIGGGTVDVHHDHRIAMTFALAALVSEEKIEIDDAECVSKSYPEFFEDLESLKNAREPDAVCE